MQSKLFVIVATGALALSSAAAIGCGPAAPTAKVAQVTPGDMPSGADWQGVYYSELYGYLHLVKDGGAIKGKWMRPAKDRWGELQGTVTGDVIRFKWTEHTIGAVGPNAKHDGRGYFKYKRPAGDNVDDQIVGEIGHGEDEVGDPWDAIRQRNMAPDLSSIGGAGSRDLGGGDWDSENKEKGKPEAPAQ
jgi:hypothetical protein